MAGDPSGDVAWTLEVRDKEVLALGGMAKLEDEALIPMSAKAVFTFVT